MSKGTLTITVSEAARLLGIGRGLAYEMARTGKLPALRFGKRLVIPRKAIERLLQEPISQEFLPSDSTPEKDNQTDKLFPYKNN
jgi:excisionase family DNA binding protein